MTLLNRLNDATINVSTLERFIANNAEEIHDWFSLEPHTYLKQHHAEIRNLTLLKWNVIRRLDLDNDANSAFIVLCLDVCERLGDSACFLRYYRLLKDHNFDIGDRLNAASLFMVGISTDQDYLDKYELVYDLLKNAYNQGATLERLLTTIVNFYALVVNNFGEFNKGVINQLKKKIEQTIAADEYSFLNHFLIFAVLGVDTGDHKVAYSQIHLILDEYLDREIHHPEAETGLLKETDTPYAAELSETESEFQSIRAISARHHLANPLRQAAFISLAHGLRIVDEESLLYAYMFAYGQMHAEKLRSSFPYVPLNNLGRPAAVIDWGCGQGTGAMVLLDHLLHQNLNLEINSITLIEPSLIALKRASLHADKYNQTTRLTTVNKLLNALQSKDFNIKEDVFIHLFSNILDIEEVSLKKLTDLIKITFPGTNYFICVGPYQDDTKRGRMDTFMNSFRGHQLDIIAQENNRAYQWRNDKQWTRILRVFSAEI